MTIPATLLIGIGSWQVVQILNLVVILIGSGFRAAAHGQSHRRWKFIDGLGKTMAYVAALIVLVATVIRMSVGA